MKLLSGMESPDSVIQAMEELMICILCHNRFNNSVHQPKLLNCKHYFCLKCIQELTKDNEMYCVNCWQPTTVKNGAQELATHNPILVLTENFSNLRVGEREQVVVQSTHEQNFAAGETCHAHALHQSLWCHTCSVLICRVCAAQDHNSNSGHQVEKKFEATNTLVTYIHAEMSNIEKLIIELRQFESHQRDFLLKVLEAAVTLKNHMEAELRENGATVKVPEIMQAEQLFNNTNFNLQNIKTPAEAHIICSSLATEKRKLEMKYQDLFLQCSLDDMIANSSIVLDFSSLKQAIQTLRENKQPMLYINNSTASQSDPIFFLANYCISKLYSRSLIASEPKLPQQNGNVITPPLHPPILPVPQNQPKQQTLASLPPPLPPIQTSTDAQSIAPSQAKILALPTQVVPSGQRQSQKKERSIPTEPSILPPSRYPRYFLEVTIDNKETGTVIIEVRPDLAPRMSENFKSLCTMEKGFGYRMCRVFQCWPGESCIMGDIDYNCGRGGHSTFNDYPCFMPDETKLPRVRGAVGMRRIQKKHNNVGAVASQFRILLKDMPYFTAIFGRVIHGLELVDKISETGNENGIPKKMVVIVNCGRYL